MWRGALSKLALAALTLSPSARHCHTASPGGGGPGKWPAAGRRPEGHASGAVASRCDCTRLTSLPPASAPSRAMSLCRPGRPGPRAAQSCARRQHWQGATEHASAGPVKLRAASHGPHDDPRSVWVPMFWRGTLSTCINTYFPAFRYFSYFSSKIFLKVLDLFSS